MMQLLKYFSERNEGLSDVIINVRGHGEIAALEDVQMRRFKSAHLFR